MNAIELFDALAALPGARSVSAQDGRDLAASRLVGGVEVTHARVVDEGALRKLWRERTQGGPVPLLLLVDDPEHEGALRALGPLSEGDPVRVVSADDLLGVLERLPAMSKLHAVRELAEELDRLDRAGTPGLVVRGLGTEHLFATRIRRTDRWAGLERTAEPLANRRTPGWREVLSPLGYQVERRTPRGYVLRHESRPVAVVLPLADPAAFARLDPDGRPPEGVLVNYCIAEGARYGILAAEGRLRLFDVDPGSGGSATGRYLELDAALLPADDRALLGLLAPAYLADGGFEELMREARAFGAGLRDRIDRAIRQDFLPTLGRELGRWAEREGWDLNEDDQRHELEAAALTFVFRVLFLLYAESAGHLPVASASYRPHSLTQIVQDAHDHCERLGVRSVGLWRRVGQLVEAMRTGDPALGVPAYNGALFAADGFAGAGALERASLPDARLGPALVALGTDPETRSGVDFSGLEIGHLGHIYEGLLSLRLSVADRPYRYEPGRDRYTPVKADEAEIKPGELLWLTNEGGRKGGGVYYTPEVLVRHIVRRAVVPAFEEHLDQVRDLVREDPAAASCELFKFRVLDPACGSAHFLVAVVDELADLVARFLADSPLPQVQRQLDDLRAGAGQTYGVGIEDVALIRRLVLKRCVYGVDLSEMGAEIAKISLWLGSFVPGLALSYLDHNVRVGNSLVGVASLDQVREPGEVHGQVGMVAQLVRDSVARGADAARGLVELPDRTPDEVAESAAADREAAESVAGARRLLDLWAAEALGLAGGRQELWERADELVESGSPLSERAAGIARGDGVLHWPLEFPEVFADEAGGFDAVVGNPPWEEITVEELAFFARYLPGLRALPEGPRDAELAKLRERRPELEDRLNAELLRASSMRAYFGAETGYVGGPGDPDLYKYFCQRYRVLLRPRGALGVVLPRSAFSAKGSEGFRRWLTDATTVERIDFLLNRGCWIFATHPQYTVALLVARAKSPPPEHRVDAAGVADSAAAFERQSQGEGVRLERDALGASLEVPLLPGQAEADLLAKLRHGAPFPLGAGRWRCFPVRELDETNDRKLWASGKGDNELWKGQSFYQYDPRGTEARPIPASDPVLRKARKPRPGSGSLVAKEVHVERRATAVAAEVGRSRVAFRDVTRATDSRTVIAALVPPGTFLTNKAPYLAFVDDDDRARAACLGLMNSLPFDWQARRFVEISLNFFILEGFRMPELDDHAFEAISKAAARLSCVDDRFEEFATSTGVKCGPVTDSERERLRIEIDAHVAHDWEVNDDELDTVLSDFTLDAVPADYRDRLRARLRELRDAS